MKKDFLKFFFSECGTERAGKPQVCIGYTFQICGIKKLQNTITIWKRKTKKIVIKNTNNIQVEYNLIYGPLN